MGLEGNCEFTKLVEGEFFAKRKLSLSMESDIKHNQTRSCGRSVNRILITGYRFVYCHIHQAAMKSLINMKLSVNSIYTVMININ